MTEKAIEAGIEADVEVITLWTPQHEVIGHVVGLFGRSLSGYARTFYCPAILQHARVFDWPTYPTPEAALAVWAKAKPRIMDEAAEYKYDIPSDMRRQINEKQLFREL